MDRGFRSCVQYAGPRRLRLGRLIDRPRLAIGQADRIPTSFRRAKTFCAFTWMVRLGVNPATWGRWTSTASLWAPLTSSDACVSVAASRRERRRQLSCRSRRAQAGSGAIRSRRPADQSGGKRKRYYDDGRVRNGTGERKPAVRRDQAGQRRGLETVLGG